MRYPIPAEARRRVEETIRRSRFIATLAHAPDEAAAKAFIAEVKDEFPDATHNCWAFAAGPPGSTARVGLSDDGEPHGTAGRPMLQTLLHSGVGEAAVVVTRWFGGTKLGTGGLVRAYTSLTVLALDGLATRDKVETVSYEVLIPYSAVSGFKRLLPEHEAEVLTEAFEADAAFTIRLPQEGAERFLKTLRDLTGGECFVDFAD